MIVYMKHPVHGYMPCSNGLEVEAAKKVGWVECGPPPWPKETTPEEKTEKQKALEAKANLAGLSPDVLLPVEDLAEEEPAELTRDQLLKLAEEAGVEINSKWSTKQIRKVLGL